MRRACQVIAGLLAWCGFGLVAAQAPDVAGYVLALDGHWTLRGSGRALVVGAPVPAREQLVARPPFERSRVVVVAARSGAVLLSHQCSQADCRQPVQLAATDDVRAAPSPWADLLRTVMAHLEREPDRLVATIARSTTRRRGALLRAADGRVDFAPVLEGLPAGSYQGRLSRLTCRQPPSCPETSLGFTADWSEAAGPAPVELAADPGLYALELGGGGGRGRRLAWVLLVRSSDHDAVAERFESAQRLAQTWGDQVQPAERETFMLATLYALAGP